MTFHDMREGQLVTLDDGEGHELTVSTTRGNHPNGVWVYRVDHGGKSVVYATDTEHYAVVDPKLVHSSDKADVLIYDSQYTPEEYKTKLGWGHSTFEEGVKLARDAHVKKLVLYHHDPNQSDTMVRDKERRSKEVFENSLAAYEGLIIEP